MAPSFAANENPVIHRSFHITRQIEKGRGRRGLYVNGSGIEIN